MNDMECERCKGLMKPGNAYGNEYTDIRRFGLYSNRCYAPEKCMKCEDCGESRAMNRVELEVYADWYKRVEA